MPRMYRSLKAYCTTLSPTPLLLDVPTSAARCLHARNDARDPSSERWNFVGENYLVILPKWRLPRHLGIFYMPQIYDMGPTVLLPLRRKACWVFFRPEKSWRLRPGMNPRTWVLKLNVCCFICCSSLRKFCYKFNVNITKSVVEWITFWRKLYSPETKAVTVRHKCHFPLLLPTVAIVLWR